MIQVQKLSKWYDGHCVFSGVGFQLYAGQCLHLRGENGSGKSTLLNILSGLEKPTVGHFRLSEQAYLLNQKQALKNKLTVYDHLLFWKSLFVSSLSIPRILSTWHMIHLESLPVYTLSLGQRKRLQLCQLSLSKAKIWLLDEPHHGLDHGGVTLLKQHIQSHLQNNGCAVLAHHGSFDDIGGDSFILSPEPRSAA